MRYALRWTLVLLLGSLAACRPPQLSGESVGHYEVRGALTENTCGAGHPAPAQVWFHVELRHLEGTIGYWKLPSAPLVEGSLVREDSFRFAERRDVVGVPTDMANGVVGCMLSREETIEGALFDTVSSEAGVADADADVADASAAADAGIDDGGMDDAGTTQLPRTDGEAWFEGTTTIRVTPQGGDCSALLLPAGGAFEALPCELRYSLGGQRLAEPLW